MHIEEIDRLICLDEQGTTRLIVADNEGRVQTALSADLCNLNGCFQVVFALFLEDGEKSFFIFKLDVLHLQILFLSLALVERVLEFETADNEATFVREVDLA